MESRLPAPNSLMTERSLGNMRCTHHLLKDMYRVNRMARLGLGSYGTVYQGSYTCPHSNAVIDLAVKQIPLNCNQQEFQTFRLTLEAQLRVYQKMRGFKHVLQLYDCVRQQMTLYLILEKCDQDFEKFWKRRTKKTQHDVRFFFMQMLQGYDCLYTRGLLHHDIKPQNFLIKDESILKISDFGLTQPKNSEKYFLKGNNRNWNNTSPEVRFGLETPRELSDRSDIWSLGATLYWMLTGNYPYQEDSTIESYRLRPLYDRIPNPQFRQIISQCLQFDPVKRINFKDLLSLSLFRSQTLAYQSYPFPTTYHQHRQLLQQPIPQQIILDVLPQSYQQISLPTQRYTPQTTSQSYEQVELESVKVNLKNMLGVCKAKMDFMKFISDQVRSYSVLENKQKWKVGRPVFYKKALLLALKGCRLAEYRYVVTLQFLVAELRKKVIQGKTTKYFMMQLANIYRQDLLAHFSGDNTLMELTNRYPEESAQYKWLFSKSFLNGSIPLTQLKQNLKELVTDFLKLLSTNIKYLQAQQLNLAYHLLTLHQSNTLLSQLTNQDSCQDLKNYMNVCRGSELPISQENVTNVLLQFIH